MVTEGVLCDQGCKTHVFFKSVGGRLTPFNVLDKKKHDCPMLHMAKLWGGRYNTIPMDYIRKQIIDVYSLIVRANHSRNLDDIMNALDTTDRELTYVTLRMSKQEDQNRVWSNELETYKENLVKEQKRREEEKIRKERLDTRIKFVRGDKL